jgi:uncharacterized protein YbgA (DUF1722 family)/uncharacterized protein YbbK (DUF523 family)
MEAKIRLGISSCLLGEKVRYDGGHKLDHFLRDTLGQYVEYVPVCPEVEMGLPTPREALRLVEQEDGPHLVFSRSGGDVTEPMLAWARERVRELEKEDLCGFIFKARSPSSGMERVKLYDRNGVPHKDGVGLFARTFMEHFPLLPVEEEGRLHDARLRENFIECIFTFRRWRSLLAGGRTPSRLVDFHSRHKLLLLSHSTEIYRELGRLVAGAGREPAEPLFLRYQDLLMKAMRLKTTPAKNCNVLQHLLGYFKTQLSTDEKRELLEVIEHYRQGHVPLVVPITLVNHYVRKYAQPYLQQQVYLNPHPLELQLRNHV